MKVGLIVPGFSASEQDWCIPALWDLVRSLSREHGVELHVFPLRYPPHRQRYMVHGAAVHPLGGATDRGVERLPLIGRSIRDIAREHRRSPFDVLHAIWADEPGVVAVMAAGLIHRPAIVSLAGGEMVDISDIRYGGRRNAPNRLMTHIALRRASRVTAGSQYLIDITQPLMPHGRLVKMPFGVNARRFNPPTMVSNESRGPGQSGDPITILHVASLIPVKDQVTLLAATAEVVRQAPAAHLHLVGDGPLLPNLRGRASQLGIDEHVHFHGAVPHHQLPDLYRSADFCVQSSRHEAQGMVVLEAAATGRATAGTGVGILPEFSDDTVSPGDARALARTITSLVCNPELRSVRSREAVRRVHHEYSLKTTTASLLDLYRDVIIQSRPGEHRRL